MDAPSPYGQHHVHVDGDVVTLRFVGPASRADTVAFHDLLEQVLAERGGCFVLADLRGLTGICAESRRYISEWNRSHRASGCAAYGASFAVRVIVTLLMNTIRLLNHDPPEFFIARDEAAARAWLDARRAALAS